jgi:hypothetical protein
MAMFTKLFINFSPPAIPILLSSTIMHIFYSLTTGTSTILEKNRQQFQINSSTTGVHNPFFIYAVVEKIQVQINLLL